MQNLTKRLIKDNAQVWDKYLHHEFVKQIESGELPKQNFDFYIKQDLIFLTQYSKCYALLAMQAQNAHLAEYAAKTQGYIIDVEQGLHKEVLGANSENLSVKDESLTNLAYTRFVRSVALEGDFADTLAALAPCALGYAYIGRNIAKNFGALSGEIDDKNAVVDSERLKNVLQNHAYAEWILTYASEHYYAQILKFEAFLDELDSEISAVKFKRLSEIFYTATRLEVAFWQHALEMKLDL